MYADLLGPEEARAHCQCSKAMAVTFSCWFSGQEAHGLRVTTTCRKWTEVIFEGVFLCVIDLGVSMSDPMCNAGGAGVSTVLFPVSCAHQSDRVVLDAPGLGPGRLACMRVALCQKVSAVLGEEELRDLGRNPWGRLRVAAMWSLMSCGHDVGSREHFTTCPCLGTELMF